MNNFLYKEETHSILSCCFEVHTVLGCGFNEIVYKDALELEFISRNIPYLREAELRIKYKDKILNRSFNADFLVFNNVILEVKATLDFISRDTSQTLNYLKASDLKVGLLVSFGDRSLKYKRLVR